MVEIKVLIQDIAEMYLLLDSCGGEDVLPFAKNISGIEYPIVVYTDGVGFAYADRSNITGNEVVIETFLLEYYKNALGIDLRLREEEVPREGEYVWIRTYQEHINLAVYNKKYDIFYNLDNKFVDKHGECDVIYWCYADVPKLPSEL